MGNRHVDWFWQDGYETRPVKLLAKFFPQIHLWKTVRELNRDAELEEFESELRDQVNDYSGEVEELYSLAKEAHRAELDRNAHLDSKAGNYLGNVGVVLSILSLAPVLSIVLGLGDPSVISFGLPELVVMLVFGYTVLALLFSAYYSTKALKIRGYSVNFTADTLKARIGEGGEEIEETVINLLLCKKSNELHNRDKNNAVSVAESLNRNGLFGLGIGVIMIIVSTIPFETIAQYIPF